MMRNVLAVVAGLVVGMALNMALVTLNTSVLYPMPEGVDYADAEAFAEYLAGLPSAAFLVVLAAHLAQSYVGGLVAAALGRSAPVALALVVGAVTLVGSVINLASLPGPTWLWVEVLLVPLTAWAAGRAVASRREGSAAR